MSQNRQCERSRDWVSLELDGELSEFEGAVLRRHLRTCAECRSFARDVRAATALVRAAPAVELDRPVQPPARTRRSGVLQRASFGAAVAAASIAAIFASGVPGDQRSSAVTSVKIAGSGNQDLQMLRAIRRAELPVAEARLDNVRVRVVEFD